MIIPPNMTEQEVLDTIENVINRLFRKFKFGYHEDDDMKQEARFLALECLSSYDNKRPLENFLWTHVRNRLFNFKRDNYQRPNRPCFTCPEYDPHCSNSTNQCNLYEDKMNCELYNKWEIRNSTKRNLMTPVSWDNVNSEYEENMQLHSDIIANISVKEVSQVIDENIPSDLRMDYIRMKYGIKLGKQRRDKVKEEVLHILQNNNINVEEI